MHLDYLQRPTHPLITAYSDRPWANPRERSTIPHQDYKPAIKYSVDDGDSGDSGEARGFKVGGGVKGEGTGRGTPLPLGVRGLCPRKNFQIANARR
jgi:hypothetical protein